MTMIRRIAMTVLALLVLAGCSENQGPNPNQRGVYMLLDTSGTYTKQLDKAEQIISYLLTQLNPGDAFAVARIDKGSFSEKDIVAKVALDDQPSRANRQKRTFQQEIQNFLENVESAPHTDITGGMLQATEYLNEHDVGKKTILVFSDMKEDLPEGYNRDIPLTLDGVNVVAVNVTKLRSDNVNPQEYLDRLDEWQKRVENAGGNWRVVNDLERLGQLLK